MTDGVRRKEIFIGTHSAPTQLPPRNHYLYFGCFRGGGYSVRCLPTLALSTTHTKWRFLVACLSLRIAPLGRGYPTQEVDVLVGVLLK